MLSDRYLRAGLDALCRSHPEPGFVWQQFCDGHRGAAVLSAWFMFHDATIEAGARDPIVARMDGEWLATGLFAPFPEQSPDPAALNRLLALLPVAVRSPWHVGHNVIFPSLALKAFHADPSLITAARVDGLCLMAQAYPSDPAAIAQTITGPHDRSAWARTVLAELPPAIAAYAGLDQGYAGHLLTYGQAVDDLYQLGHIDIARQAEIGFREYIGHLRQGPEGPFKRETDQHPHDDLSNLPGEKAFWERRPGNALGLGHVLKYTYALNGFIARSADEALNQRCLRVAPLIFPHVTSGY